VTACQAYDRGHAGPAAEDTYLLGRTAGGPLVAMPRAMPTTTQSRRKLRLKRAAILLGCLCVGGALFVITNSRTHCAFPRSLNAAKALETVAALYVVERGVCPTPEQLIASKIVGKSSTLHDKWESPFRIHCSEADIVVTSAGPDRKFGTHDDLSTQATEDWPLE